MKFIPYCNESEINDCSDNTILKVIYEMEELFATENCKKELSIYRCENEVIKSYFGFAVDVVSISSNEINVIVSEINKRFGINMIKDAFHNNNIGDGAMALESIFHFIYDASADARIMNSLNEQLLVLENTLGKYRGIYSVNIQSYGLNEEQLFSPFYITDYSWVIIFDRYVLLLSYGSYE